MSIKSLPALETALAHRSIRKFSDKPVPPEILAALMDAGRMASTSNHLQCVSVIRITDAAIRAGIRRAASDMAYVTECPEFLLFCVDFHKHHLLLPEAQTDWAEALLIGAVDTGIMAQNVLLVAESLGLGGVYIGALRNERYCGGGGTGRAARALSAAGRPLPRLSGAGPARQAASAAGSGAA